MSKSPINAFQIFNIFSNEQVAKQYIESRKWPDGVICPGCKNKDKIATRKNGYYRCNSCRLDFTVRTGTILGRSHIPLQKWLYAMYIILTSRKDISSLKLSKEIGITQKSAWFMLQRIREACGHDFLSLQGVIEN